VGEEGGRVLSPCLLLVVILAELEVGSNLTYFFFQFLDTTRIARTSANVIATAAC